MALKNRKKIFTVIGILLLTSELLAETVILKNKQVFKGKVTSQNELQLSLTTNNGKAITFEKRNILKVVYKDLSEQEVKKIILEEEKKIDPKEKKPKDEVKDPKNEPTKDTKVEAKEVPNKWNIVWRSALVPGWGQWKAGRKAQGVLAFFIVAGAAGYVVSQRDIAHSAEAEYKSKSTIFGLGSLSTVTSTNVTSQLLTTAVVSNSLFVPYQSAVTNANNAFNVLAIAGILQIGHAYYVGRNWEREGTQTNTVYLNGKAINEGWNFNSFTGSSVLGVKNRNYEISYAFHF
jgi:hypothetical protein